MAAALVIFAGVLLALRLGNHPPIVPECTFMSAPPQPVTYTFGTDQAANAATIAAVGKTLGLPDHAVTVALAAALQESKLTNLAYGDRDSVGLFQQRPSEGWGTSAQLTDPEYAATAFYQRLEKVPGWEAMSVADAAQSVQHSAAGGAYAGWEPQARAMAEALTGELPAAVACTFPPPSSRAPLATIERQAAADLGPDPFGTAVTAARGWTIAGWAVAHAQALGITTVSFDGRQWQAASGQWRTDPAAGPTVTVGTS